ncbi:MAG: FAD-dependent oxidoreductase [Burkholderiales bacterium]|nr:FAD-dependent oxidoreductase [Burkholderiales bacterium]
MKRLVLVGGGHSHAEVLRSLGDAPLRGVEVVLVSPSRYTPYSGMLPGLVAGHYRHDACHLDLARLAGYAGCEFVVDAAVAIDPARRIIRLRGGGALDYTVASLDIGSTPRAIPGASEHGIGVKPWDRFLHALETLIACARRGELRRLVVVGGGAAGVEVLLAVEHRFGREGQAAGVDMRLVTDADRLLPDHNDRVRRIFARTFARRGLKASLATRVTRVDAGELETAGGERFPFDAVVLATGAEPAGWPSAGGLAVDASGFVLVDERLASVSHPEVFAAGDIATMRGHPRPKSGVFAVRHGPPLARNLRRELAGEPLESFVPQRAALALITTGDRRAVMSRGRWALEGAWVWRWKDWIDRRFMNRYRI